MTAAGAFVADIDRDARRALVEGRADVDGIDFVEVLSNLPGSPGHVGGAPALRTLLVHLLNRAVPSDLRSERVVIIGGVRADPRVNPVGVEWAYPADEVAGTDLVGPTAGLAGVGRADRALVDAALSNDHAGRERVLVVRTTSSGDWSGYVLHLTGVGGSGAPDGFDIPLAQAPFTFTVDCPSELDCRVPEVSEGAALASPVLDYLARDAEALRTRLLDRLSILVSDWQDRSAADTAVMLVELFAYLGDHLAYWQDAVAVEAHLGTARRRMSARRHARLLGYRVHEGCSARVLLTLTTDTALVLPGGAAVSDTPAQGELTPVEATENGAVVVETCDDVELVPARNAIALHAWGDPDHVLAVGAVSAYLAVPSAADPGLGAGDLVVLADCPAGRPSDAALGDPASRFAVRLDRDPVVHVDVLDPSLLVLELHWHPEDALRGPLRISEPGPDGRPTARAAALANVVLADHGASTGWELLEPPHPTPGAAYRPRLARTALAFAQPTDPDLDRSRSASALLQTEPRAAEPQLTVDDGGRIWQPRPDLVGSGRLDAHVVVEPEPGGIARLRFGDGITGRAPGDQATYTVRYRLGGGERGNVTAGRLTSWLRRADGSPSTVSGARIDVWNPLGGTGGADPEDLDAVRQLAPAAYRQQFRATTSADYAATAEEVSGVQRSVARRRWTGSWYAQEVTVDPRTERSDDPAVTAAVQSLLETRRTAGVDVELAPPSYVPLELELFGCVAVGYRVPDVEHQVLDVLSSRVLPDGRTGFFHPDRFTFGQSLLLSDLVSAAMAIEGLSLVEVRRFGRLGAGRRESAATLAAGRIPAEDREVLRCDSDPNNPEMGRIDVVLGGGS